MQKPKELVSRLIRPVPKTPERRVSAWEAHGGWSPAPRNATPEGGGSVQMTPEQIDGLAGEPLTPAQREGIRVRAELAKSDVTPW